MKQNQKKIIAILLTVLILFLTGCDKQMSEISSNDQSSLKIGVIAPLSGDAAAYGLASKEGLDLAVKEINENGGILGKKIELLYEDSEINQQKAVSIMSKFVNVDNLDIVIVADGSGSTMAVAPFADSTQTLMIATLGSTPKLSNQGEYIFRTVPSDSYQGLVMTKEANKFSNVAILYVNDAYGVGLKDVIEANYNGNIVSTQTFDASESDFRSQLTKIKSKNPEAILIIARQELPNILKQIKELEIKSKLLGSETTKYDDLIKSAGSSAEGFQAVYFAEETDYANYKSKFQTHYNKEPEYFGDYSYDGVYVLKEAIEKANSFDPTEIKNAMMQTKFYGATGIVEFDNNGDVTNKPFSLFEVQNGSFVEISS